MCRKKYRFCITLRVLARIDHWQVSLKNFYWIYIFQFDKNKFYSKHCWKTLYNWIELFSQVFLNMRWNWSHMQYFWLYSVEYSRFIIISIQLVIPNISRYRFLIVDLLTVTLTNSSYSKASQIKAIKGNVLRGFSSGNISSPKGYHNVVLNLRQRPLSNNVTTPATSSETLTIMERLTTSKYIYKRTIAA